MTGPAPGGGQYLPPELMGLVDVGTHGAAVILAVDIMEARAANDARQLTALWDIVTSDHDTLRRVALALAVMASSSFRIGQLLTGEPPALAIRRYRRCVEDSLTQIRAHQATGPGRPASEAPS